VRRIEDSRFAVIGAGGLGGPVALALAAAGAGRLRLFDGDRVELSNLQRQVQFAGADLGRPKAASLAATLVARGYPAGRVEAIDRPLGPDQAAAALAGIDVVIDGTDSPATKFLVNDTCRALGIAAVIAAAARWGGQLLAVHPGQAGCYRCLFEAPPAGDDALSCSDAGVIGAAVAVVAGHAARAALALATGDGAGDTAELIAFDDLRRSTEPRRVRFRRRRDCRACAGAAAVAAKEAS